VSGGHEGRLPAAFLAALRAREEVLVTSRSGPRLVTVPMTCAVSDSGDVYLMTSAFSRKAVRWERDPWVRMAIPGSPIAAEAVVRPVGVEDLDDAAEAAILERFATAGAATPESLRQTLVTGTQLLFRVQPAPGV
jgi:hypothetical protein